MVQFQKFCMEQSIKSVLVKQTIAHQQQVSWQMQGKFCSSVNLLLEMEGSP